MRIKDRLASQPKVEPFTVTADQMVSEAVTTMAERNYGSAIVVDGASKVTGIVTERDILKRLVGKGKDARDTPVSAIMTSDPSCASEADEIEQWMRAMSQDRFRRVPVVDADHKIKAVLTQTDLVAYAWPVLLAQAKEIAERDAQRKFYALLIGGGLLVYAVAVVILFSVLT